MSTFAFLLLVGVISGGYRTVFGSNCCESTSSCAAQVNVATSKSDGKTPLEYHPCDKDNTYYYKHYCVKKCPIGYYSKSGRCEKCHTPPCPSCVEKKCLSCSNNLYLLKEGVCKETCPPKSHAPLMKNSTGRRVRLVEGSSRLEGVVEVYYNGTWGTVCANGWDGYAAKALCKELKLGYNVEDKIVGQDRFARKDRYKDAKIWLSGVHCTGKENSILDCTHDRWGENHCSHLEDVGVRCSGPDMTRTCEATCGAGYFSLGQKCLDCPLDCKTCSSRKNCTSCFEERYLEGGSCVAECKPGTYGDRKTLKCATCPDTCELCKWEEKGPECTSCAPNKKNNIINGDECVSDCGGSAMFTKYLRLSGNHSSPYMGLLEVKYQGAWHTVCDDMFTLNTARVFCRELGYGQPIKYAGSLYGVGSGKIIARDVVCKGDEESFLDCRQRKWFPDGCSHREDVGLWCKPPPNGDVMTNRCMEKCTPSTFENKKGVCELCNQKCLTCTGSPDNCLACRLPFFHNGTTCVMTCPDGTYANVTLRACLPCSPECMTCTGREDNCLSCVEPLLQNGTHCGKTCPAGMYQKEFSCVRDCGLRHYPKTEEGLCHACSLGCLLCADDSKCTACEHAFVLTKQGKCRRGCPSGQLWTPVDPKSVGVDLSLRLSSVENHGYKGRLEIKHKGVWGTICDDLWGRDDAEVACRQLFLGPPVKINYLRSQTFKELNISKIWLDNVDCKGTEERIEDCKANDWGHENCVHSEDVHIECARPGISTCEDQCPPAFYSNGTNCIACSVNCLNCSGSPNNCSLCSKDYFRNGTICTKDCPLGYYKFADKTARQCRPCHKECQTCSGPEDTDCTSCGGSTMLQKVMCVSNCSGGFRKRGRNPNIELWRKVGPYEGVVRITLRGQRGFICDRYLRLQQGEVVCRELQMGNVVEVYQSSMYSYYSTPKLLNNPICVGNESSIFDCPVRGLKYCTHRSIMSVKCSGPDKSRICMKDCPIDKNFYVSSDNTTCGVCSRDCLRCEKNATRCTDCHKGFFLTWDNKCVDYCREGTFFDVSSKKCEKCNLAKCIACQANKDICTVCRGGKYRGTGGCQEDCHGNGYARIGSDQVRLVADRQYTPTFNTNTTRGVVEMFVDEDWVPVCAYGFSIKAAAVVCHQLGLGDPVKISLVSKFVMRHPYEKIRKLNCTGTEYELKKCATSGQCPHYRLAVVTCSRSAAKRRCVKPCGPSFYLTADKKECRLCSDNCTTCTGTASTCTSCNNTNVLHKSKCMESCPDGYFIHLKNKRCERCSDKCKTCLDGWTNDSCSSCNRPYYLRGTSCVESCYPDRVLENLMGGDKPPIVRLVNGSRDREGFVQIQVKKDLWGLLCTSTSTFITTLVCQELGFQGGQIVRNSYFLDNNVERLSTYCRGYESSIKDCFTAGAFWCPRPPVVACSNKPLDKRVCRKENDVPCARGVCSEKVTCVDGDDKIIPKEHSYCKYCPVNSYGDGYTCTVISKVQPTVRQTYWKRTLWYGRRYHLPCHAKSGGVYIYPDRYGWFKDGERMQTSSSSRSMFIGPVHYQDTGIYTCIMKNSVGSVNVTYNVTVFGPPEIKRADNVVVIHNVSTLLTCEVLAHPPATISWHLGNITFSENSTEDGGPRVLNNGSLYIPRPSRKDAGNYSCRAQNKNAAVSQNIELRVGEDLRFEKEANSEHVAKGGKAVFACRPFPTQFGPHLIQWRRNGVTLKNGGRYKVGDGSLTINDVRSDDCGEYYCVAKDENSIITSVGRLSIVDEPPCIHTPPKNLELEDGMYARFYCAASGNPPPKIFWQGKEQNKSNVFEIQKVNISHVGVYKCTAQSGGRSKDAYAFLSVNDHHPCPFIFQKPKDIAAVFGKQATFFCDGVGTLHVSFKWYKGAHQLDDGDKYKLTNNNKNLTIINVNENDIGKYKCTLTGMYGKTSAEASLTSATVGASKSSSSPNTAGIVIGVLICILVILIILYFVHRYRRYGATPVDVMKNVKRKTFFRFQPRTPHTVLKGDDEDDEEEYDTSDTNPFVRD